jgi:hypothetical protein
MTGKSLPFTDRQTLPLRGKGLGGDYKNSTYIIHVFLLRTVRRKPPDDEPLSAHRTGGFYMDNN